MKHMQIFIFMIVLLMASGCQQTREQPSASTSSLAYSAPVLIEGKDNALGQDSLRDHATFHFTYPDMAAGHTLKLRWKGRSEYYTPTLTVKSPGTLAFRVPKAEVIKDLGGSAMVTVSVGKPGKPLEISDPVSVQVQASLPFAVPAPQLQGQAANGEYALGAGDASVQVSYPAMKVGDIVGLRWQGRATTDLPTQKVNAIAPVTFRINRAVVAQDLDSAAVLTASVGGDGNPLRISQALSATIVEGAGSFPPPVAEEAVAGELDLNRIASHATLRVEQTGLVNGDTIGMRWKGVDELNLPVQRYQGTGPLRFEVPKATIAKDLGGTARVTASLGRDGNPLVISAPLDLKVVQSAVPPGEAVAIELNRRYRAIPDACAGNPAYYCSGVLSRATNNDSFDPWNPSPGAVTLGSVSFSYLRMDSHVKDLYGRAGFIFKDQETAIAEGKAQALRCFYPYNASTASNKSNNGCGLRPRLVAADQSSCAAIGVTTAAQWIADANRVKDQHKQCSLSTEVASQFLAGLEAKGTRVPGMTSGWNEVLVVTWAQNIGERLPIEAFYYKAGNATALADAKVYQQKYKTRTALWVPVIKLDQAQYGKGDPFSYSQSDQAIQP